MVPVLFANVKLPFLHAAVKVSTCKNAPVVHKYNSIAQRTYTHTHTINNRTGGSQKQAEMLKICVVGRFCVSWPELRPPAKSGLVLLDDGTHRSLTVSHIYCVIQVKQCLREGVRLTTANCRHRAKLSAKT